MMQDFERKNFEEKRGISEVIRRVFDEMFCRQKIASDRRVPISEFGLNTTALDTEKNHRIELEIALRADVRSSSPVALASIPPFTGALDTKTRSTRRVHEPVHEKYSGNTGSYTKYTQIFLTLNFQPSTPPYVTTQYPTQEILLLNHRNTHNNNK